MNEKKSLAKSYIALGSNIGDPIANVRQAIDTLSKAINFAQHLAFT